MVWSLPGIVPSIALWATGLASATEAFVGMLGALVIAGLLAWWRHRQLVPLVAWLERLRIGRSVTGAVPDSFLYRQLPHPLLAIERETQNLRRQVAASDQLQRALVDAITDPVLVVDGRGYVRLANPAAERHFADKLTDQPLGRFLRDPAILAAIDSAIRANVSSTVSFSPPLDRTRRYTCGIQPMLTREGDAAAVLSLRETSEQVAIERMRSDFIANASHELRTPLTALAGFVETLKGPAKNDPDAQAMFLDTMDAEASRMTRLIDDLLSLSKLEADVHRPPSEDVDLADVVALAISGLEPQLRKNATVVEARMEDGPLQVRGDADQLQQLVANLIDNASKYGRPGAPVVVDVARLSPAGDEAGPLSGRTAIRLTVIDQGDGIAPEHLPRLTERFYRVDKSRSRRAGGTGLGLAISKHIIRRHGGHLNVESDLGIGSRFSVFIPAR
jgi:two-component system phosphate regulon sensor histidine kinase PhoR